MKQSTQVSMAIPSSHRHKATNGPDLARNYLAGLDGWRAIAILWVILSHNPLLALGPINDIWIKGTGYRGVQLFFALSGLLICNRLLAEEKLRSSISISRFYLRRLFRIQPAALTYLGVVTVLMLCGLIPRALDGVAGATLMVRNYFPRRYGGGEWYAIHFWSLAVEEHFYLLFPSFLFFCRRYRIRVLLTVVAVCEIWRLQVFTHDSLQHIGVFTSVRTDVNLSEILLGSIFALALNREEIEAWATIYLKPWVALLYAATVIFLLARYNTRVYHLVLITIYPVVIASTMIHTRSWTTRVLELPAVRFIGKISFSLYLWQQMFFNPEAPAAPQSFRAHTPLLWLLTFACSVASYYLVEKPVIRFGHRLLRQPRPASAAIASS